MSLFGSLIGAALDVVTLPVDVVSDVVTAGNGEESAISRKARRLNRDVDQIMEDIENLELI